MNTVPAWMLDFDPLQVIVNIIINIMSELLVQYVYDFYFLKRWNLISHKSPVLEMENKFVSNIKWTLKSLDFNNQGHIYL